MSDFWEWVRQRWILPLFGLLVVAIPIILAWQLDADGLENLAGNLPSEGVGAGVGIVITYLIVDWVVSHRERERFRPARRHFSSQLLKYAEEVLQSFEAHPQAQRDWNECQDLMHEVFIEQRAIEEIWPLGARFLAEDEELLDEIQMVEAAFNDWRDKRSRTHTMSTDEKLAAFGPLMDAAAQAICDLRDYLKRER